MPAVSWRADVKVKHRMPIFVEVVNEIAPDEAATASHKGPHLDSFNSAFSDLNGRHAADDRPFRDRLDYSSSSSHDRVFLKHYPGADECSSSNPNPFGHVYRKILVGELRMSNVMTRRCEVNLVCKGTVAIQGYALKIEYCAIVANPNVVPDVKLPWKWMLTPGRMYRFVPTLAPNSRSKDAFRLDGHGNCV